MFDLATLIRQLKETPEGRALIDASDTTNDDEALAARVRILDQLPVAEAAEAKAVSESAKFRAAFEETQEKMIEARGKLGAAEQRKNAASGKVSALRRELRVDHGEQSVIDVERRLTGLSAYLPGRIEALEVAAKAKPQRGAKLIDSETLASYRRQASEMRDQLAAVKHGLEVVAELRGARIAPREIARRCQELMELVGIADE